MMQGCIDDTNRYQIQLDAINQTRIYRCVE